MAGPLRPKLDVIHKSLDFQWLPLAVIGLLALHCFIFRDLLAAAPAMARNEASVVREELVPFFDFNSQYNPANNSKLTGSDEFRVAYSYWTSWTRYNAVLPYALVLVNTISAVLLFYAFYRLVRYFVDVTRPRQAAYIALLGALIIHIVLLYSKVAHYYTLILGFSMFALALSLALEQFFFKRRFQWSNVVPASLLILLNPAIHYHVIAYLTIGVTLLLQAVFLWITRRPQTWMILRRNTLYFAIVAVSSLLPYLAYLRLVLPSASGALTQAPVDYWSIFYSSVPLTYLFALDGLGHVDLYRHGNYLAPTPRIMTVLVFASVGLIFLNRAWQNFEEKRKSFLIVLFMLMLTSLWMSIGYSSNSLFSFHQLLGVVSAALADVTNSIGLMAQRAVGLFINVLRYPHRFELVLYYAAGVMICIGLVQLHDLLQKRRVGAAVRLLLLVSVAVVPFLLSGDYRQTLVSGNFGGFLEPYRVPADLRAIKATLASTQSNRVFIVPSLESGREIIGDKTNYRFLDKYLIYYLNQPSIYYGGGASNDSKIVSFMAYRAIASGQDWWQDILIDDLDITHILVPQKLSARTNGTVYMPEIDSKLRQALERSDRFERVSGGEDYLLYRATDRQAEDKAVLADYSWQNFATSLPQKALDKQRLFLPVQLDDYLDQPQLQLATDNPERSFYRLYVASQSKRLLPNSSQLPFRKDYIASSNFTANMFSMSKLYNKQDTYNYVGEVLPTMASLSTAQFVGMKQNSNISISTTITVPADGTHRLVVYAASKSSEMNVKLAGQDIKLRRISPPPSQDQIDFEYYTADVRLSKGKYDMRIQSAAQTILVEHSGLIPAADVPQDYKSVALPGLQISPNVTKGIFTVTLKSRDDR